MELRELRSLQLLATNGSLSETARLVHLTPAAVHKQLRQLERELDVPLYERRDRRMRLTPAAELVLPYFREMLNQHQGALRALEEWKGVRRGLVRVGAGPSLATYLLPPILSRFRREHPSVDLDIQTGSSAQLIDGLASGALDIILVVATGAAEQAPLEVAAELQVEVVIVSTLSEGLRRCRLRRLSREPFLLFRKGARIEFLIDQYLHSHGVSPDIVMRFDSAEALKATLKAGSGVSMLPLYSIQSELQDGTLRVIRQHEAPLLMPLHLMLRGQTFTPPAVRSFVEAAQQSLADSSLCQRRSR